MMGRSDITNGLSTLLERKLSDSGVLWSREVSIEPLGRVRPDYVSVAAPWGKFASVSSIERASITVYEVKSCLADYKSGNGLNAVGDSNFIVAPYELMMKVKELAIDKKIPPTAPWGWMYPVPSDFSKKRGVECCLGYEGQIDGWKLYAVDHIQGNVRNAPVIVFLWAMMYAGVNRGFMVDGGEGNR